MAVGIGFRITENPHRAMKGVVRFKVWLWGLSISIDDGPQM